MKTVLAVVGVVLFGGLAPASGHEARRTDGNEPNLKVDIREVFYDHPGRRTVVKTTMREELRKRHVTNGLIGWALDTKGDATPDFVITSQYDFFEERYFCSIRTALEKEFVADVDGFKGDDYFKCRFRRNLVGGVAEHFSSFASYDGDSDDAPDMLQYRHRAKSMSFQLLAARVRG